MDVTGKHAWLLLLACVLPLTLSSTAPGDFSPTDYGPVRLTKGDRLEPDPLARIGKAYVIAAHARVPAAPPLFALAAMPEDFSTPGPVLAFADSDLPPGLHGSLVDEAVADSDDDDGPPLPIPRSPRLKERLAQQLAAAEASAEPAPVDARPAPSPRSSGPWSVEALRKVIERYAALQNIPADIVHAVVMVESRFNPRATGRGGYIGLMQIGYPTAKSLGYTGTVAGLYDPETNLRYGIEYLAQAYRMVKGNLCAAVSKYQGGHRVVGVTRAGAVYCSKVKTYLAALEKTPKPTRVADASPPDRRPLLERLFTP
jgi:soluble lytic murein transglycosylase-like protein